eukprot:150089_1
MYIHRGMNSLSTMLSSISIRCSSFSSIAEHVTVSLNTLSPAPGSTHQRRRVGRGNGSGRGKTCGRGQKGQKSRSGGGIKLTFEGGQTPLHRRIPKHGFVNGPDVSYNTVSIRKIIEFIAMGRLKPRENDFITMKDLTEAGVTNKIKHGVKILGPRHDELDGIPQEFREIPLHLEVSAASKTAINAVEDVGGTVTCTHFNRLALRALLKPHKFEDRIFPRRARPPPKEMPIFLDWNRRGYLSPEVQTRNLKLFGKVTSEKVLQNQTL